jgi:hypothetical protein
LAAQFLTGDLRSVSRGIVIDQTMRRGEVTNV